MLDDPCHDLGRHSIIRTAEGDRATGYFCENLLGRTPAVGIKGGVVYGRSDKIGAFPAADPVEPTDLHATVYHTMGLDPHRVIHDHLERPFPVPGE
jgi:hypothetical protein